MDLSSLTKFTQNIAQSSMSLVKVVLLSKWNTKRHKSTNDKAIILGNGPSLNESVQTHRSAMQSMDLWAVNDFPRTPLFKELKPGQYVFIAPEYWIDDVRQSYIDNREIIFKILSEEVDWSMTIFAPIAFRKNKKYRELLAGNSNLKLVYFNTSPIEGFQGLSNTLIGANLGMPRPHNVLIPSLILAIQSGYKEINVVGADHSWIEELTVNENNEAMVHQKHFYDEDSSKSEAMYKLGRRPRLLHEILEKFVYAFRSYHFIRQFSEKKGAKIWNLTPKSFIDAFDRRKTMDS